MAKKVVVKAKAAQATSGARAPVPPPPPGPATAGRNEARPPARPQPPSIGRGDDARTVASKAPVTPAPVRRDVRPPPQLDLREAGEEHRQFPRAKLGVRFDLWIDEGTDRRFSASLKSENLSVSGAFLESTFFLPLGTELRARFRLDEGDEPVEARARIVREERGEDGDGRSGFGVRFVEFYSQTEVTLAKLFLGQRLREFAEEYLHSRRARSLGSELDRVVDALAAWELLKVTSPADPWRER